MNFPNIPFQASDQELEALKILKLEGPLTIRELRERGCALWNGAHFMGLERYKLIERSGKATNPTYSITTEGCVYLKERSL